MEKVFNKIQVPFVASEHLRGDNIADFRSETKLKWTQLNDREWFMVEIHIMVTG